MRFARDADSMAAKARASTVVGSAGASASGPGEDDDYGLSTQGTMNALAAMLFPVGNIFISYRRSDSGEQAIAIYAAVKSVLEEGLASGMSREQKLSDSTRETFETLESADAVHGKIFMDVQNVAAGQDFKRMIDEALSSSIVVLALIGPTWETVADKDGARRIDKVDDYVHMELEAALSRGGNVIPVLVARTAMPDAGRLPAALQGLARRNAIAVSGANSAELERVKSVVREALTARRNQRLEEERQRTFVQAQRAKLVEAGAMSESGAMMYPDGRLYRGEVMYTGEMMMSLPIAHGTGIMQNPDGSRTEGRWSHGQITIGVMQWADGDRYEGEFREGKKDGLGAYTFAYGERYLGQFRENLKHGFGATLFQNGARFDGEYRQDQRWAGVFVYHGIPLEAWADGRRILPPA